MSTYTTLRKGSKGEAVKKLQRTLETEGYSVGTSGVDGRFGDRTALAVTHYQRDKGLEIDGIAGPQTLASLYDGTVATQSPSLRATDALEAYVNRDVPHYDFRKDPVYQQYSRDYVNLEGEARKDARAMTSALAGGYGNSYAQSVGQQRYGMGAESIVPELMQLSYQREQYKQAEDYRHYKALADWENREYTRGREALGDQRQMELEYQQTLEPLLQTKENLEFEASIRQYLQTYTPKNDEEIPKYQDYLARLQYLEAESQRKAAKARQKPEPKIAEESPTVIEYDNSGVTDGNVKVMERMLGLADDGRWTAEDSQAAGGMTAQQAYERYQRGQLQNYKSVGVAREMGTVQSWAKNVESFVNGIQQNYRTWSGGEKATRAYGSDLAKAATLLEAGKKWRETYQNSPDAVAAIDEINAFVEEARQFAQTQREYFDFQETTRIWLDEQIVNTQWELDRMERLLPEYQELSRWEQSGTRFEQIQKKYSSVAGLEDAIAQKKAHLQDLRTKQKTVNWGIQYQGRSYQELREIAETLPEGIEKAWLREYAVAIMTKEDYETELALTQWELGRKTDLLEEYQELTRWEQNAAGQQRIEDIAKNYGSVADLQNEVRELQTRKQSLENGLRYNFLWENPDYEELSRYQEQGFGWDVPQYERINDPEAAKIHENIKGAGLVLGNAFALLPDGYYDNTHLMTEAELKNYNYLHAKEGTKAADDYMEYLAPTLNQRHQQNLAGMTEKAANILPVTTSALSTPIILLSGLGTLDVAYQNLEQAITGETAPIDYNQSAMSFATIGSTIRETVSQNIVDATGSIQLDKEKHPLLSKVLNGKSLADVYQMGMSMQDSAAVTALSIVNPALGYLGAAMLAGAASTQAMLDAVQRGATDQQALTIGLLAGGIEMAFESIKLDNLLSVTDDVAIKMIKEALCEGLGEGATTYANYVADAYVALDHSQLETDIRKYQQEHPDWSRERAAREALVDMLIQVEWDGVFGMISGGIFGGTVSAMQNSSNINWKALENLQTFPEDTVDFPTMPSYDGVFREQTTSLEEPGLMEGAAEAHDQGSTQSKDAADTQPATNTQNALSTLETPSQGLLTQSTQRESQTVAENRQTDAQSSAPSVLPQTTGQQNIRETLQNLPESAVRTDGEARVLSSYRQTLEQLHTQHRVLERINSQIATLSAKQTTQNGKQIRTLQTKAKQVEAKITAYEAVLQQTESSDVVQEVLKRAGKPSGYVEIAVEKQSPYDIISVEASILPNRFEVPKLGKTRRLEIIQKGIALEKPIFTDDLLGRLARGIKPDPDYYDVVLHGEQYCVFFFGEKIDVETLCAIIAQRKDYQKGMNIRLISCNTGEKADGVAQYIADKLHVKVLAPDKKAIVTKTVTGKTIVYSGSKEGVHDGKFILFENRQGEEQ